MLQILVHNFGSTIAVGLKSRNKEEIIQNYYSLYNLKATGGEIHWIDEGGPVFFGHIWTSIERLRKWFFDSSFRILLNKRDIMADETDENIEEIKKEAIKLAEFRMNKINYDGFLATENITMGDSYDVAVNDLRAVEPSLSGRFWEVVK